MPENYYFCPSFSGYSIAFCYHDNNIMSKPYKNL